MMYSAIIIGNEGQDNHEAMIHNRECRVMMPQLAVAMLHDERVEIATLDADCEEVARVEIRVVFKVPVDNISVHDCSAHIPEEKVMYRINDVGAVVARKAGKAVVLCSYCGVPNSTWNLSCDSCKRSLWSGLRDRLYEYNRRLREAIKTSNKRQEGVSKHMIMEIVEAVGNGNYTVDENGYAKEVKHEKEKVVVDYPADYMDRHNGG